MKSQAELELILRARDLASKEVDKVGSSLDRTAVKSSKLGQAFKIMGGLAKAAIIGIGIAVIGLVPEMLELAKTTELLQRKSKIVFADQLPIVQKWASEVAGGMGLTRTQATGLAADFADLLIPMGFTRAEAAKISTEIVGLSGVLAEWSGGTKDAAQVSDILAKAMLGEREGLKELGIGINEADVKNQMLEDGTADLTGELGEQAKALATAKLIMEKSKDAQDAYATGAGTMARRTNEAKAQIGELAEYLSGRLARGLDKVIVFVVQLGDFLWGDGNGPLARALRGIGKLFGVFGQIIDGIAKSIVDLINLVKNAISWLGSLVQIGSGPGKVDFSLNSPGLPPLPVNPKGGGPQISSGAGGMQVSLVGVSQSQLTAMIEEDLFFKLRRAATTPTRV